MVTVDYKVPLVLVENRELFDGFPYLMTRFVPGCFYITLLPGDTSHQFLFPMAAAQAYVNRLETSLVLAENCSYRYDDVGKTATRLEYIPRRGVLLVGDFKPFRDFHPTFELERRQKQFELFVERNRLGKGALFGDLTKGGRNATPEELIYLAGRQENGVPVGLKRCPVCGEWAGECIDPSPDFKNQLMNVNCLCDNDNLCAACGRWLHHHKLNANFYKPEDGCIWHVPGFCALDHRCWRGLE